MTTRRYRILLFIVMTVIVPYIADIHAQTESNYSEDVQQLLEDAAVEFKRGYFIIAYNLYAKVLESEPANRHAWEGLYEILNKYVNTPEEIEPSQQFTPDEIQTFKQDLFFFSNQQLIGKIEEFQENPECSVVEDILDMLEFGRNVLHDLFDPNSPEIKLNIGRIDNLLATFEPQYENLCHPLGGIN